jgi:hypothetical protein
MAEKKETGKKKSLLDKAKNLLALVIGKRKPSGIWFNIARKKKAVPPTEEQLKEFLEKYVPDLVEKIKERIQVAPGEFASDMEEFDIDGVDDGDADNAAMASSNSLSQRRASKSAQYLYNWLQHFSAPGRSAAFGFNPDESDLGGPRTGIADGEEAVVSVGWGNTKVPAKSKSNRIAKKPIEVRGELEMQPVPWTLENLDEKIELLNDKSKVVNQHYTKTELKGIIERLENRKKYNEFRSYFEQFPNTTDEKIDQLLSKYLLVMKESDIFVPEFPKEAITVMREYTEQVKKLCNKIPVFCVIAEQKMFEKSWEKRDPILLAQSPFGFYYQILGAWDKEMILLSEL